MSRSYKKYPVIVQEKDDMRRHNRKLRHNKLAEIPNGCFYKKGRGHTYYKYMWSEQDAREHYRRFHGQKYYFHVSKFETEEDYINWWKKETICK